LGPVGRLRGTSAPAAASADKQLFILKWRPLASGGNADVGGKSGFGVPVGAAFVWLCWRFTGPATRSGPEMPRRTGDSTPFFSAEALAGLLMAVYPGTLSGYSRLFSFVLLNLEIGKIWRPVHQSPGRGYDARPAGSGFPDSLSTTNLRKENNVEA
jgi:hypothetical protein